MLTLNFKSLFVLLAMTYSWCAFAQSKPLKVAVGLAKPPFINEDLKTGYEIELLQLIFSEAKIPIEVVNMSNSRMLHDFEQKKVDVMINTHAKVEGAYPTSIPYIIYQNVAVTKKSKNLKVDTIKDLGARSVGAFQNAKKLLGPEFQKAAEGNKSYREFAQQQAQVQMLASDRIEVAIMEQMIFKSYAKELGLKLEDYHLHRIFPANRYSTAFQDAQIRDKFDAALSSLKKQGLVQKLAERHRIHIEK